MQSFWCTFLSWPLFTLFFMVYAHIVEEPVLEKRFGKKYLFYKKSVPLLFEFPFKKALKSVAVRSMNYLSLKVNKPFILKYENHLFFLGYGLWVGAGGFAGLVFMSLFLLSGNIAAISILWIGIIFTISSLIFSRLVSMFTLMSLEKVNLKTAWFRVGFVSWGVFAAAILCGFPYLILTHNSLPFWFDAVFSGMIIAHVFGRIGCLFYGCCYGRETLSPIRIKYTHSSLKAVREKRVKLGTLYPTQLFSALYGLFIVLIIISVWSINGIGVGIPTCICLILYGIFRFMEEWFRFQKKKVAGIFSPAQLICFGLVLFGLFYFGWLNKTAQMGFHAPLIQLSSGDFFNIKTLLLMAGLGMLTTLVFSYHRFEIGLWGKETEEKQDNNIMELKYKEDTLYCHNWQLSQLAEKFGTPLFIISKQAAQASIKNFQDSFQALSVPVKLHYSVKTNPIPGFLQILKDEGLSVEIISEHELILSKKIGFNWQDIVVNGPAKSQNFLKKLINSNVKMVNIESLSDLENLKAVNENAARPINVGVRICPGFSLAKLNPTLNSSAKHSPYGFQADSPELNSVLDKIKGNKNFHFIGFHIHLGSGIKDSRPYRKAFFILEKTIKKASEMGLKSSIIDIGGGFGLSTAPILNASQLVGSTFFKKNVEFQASKNGSILHDVAQHLETMLKRLRSSNIRINEVLVEPGRIISGPSELLILSVLDVIEQSHGNNYLICDGGALSLSPLLLTEHHRIMSLSPTNGTSLNYTVLGNMPTSMDKLSSSMSLPPMSSGDRIVLLDTGAYFVSMNNNFAGPRPAIVLLDEKKAFLTRRRESIEEMYQRDNF